MVGREIKFRPGTFYLEITDRLANEVEGKGEEMNGVEGEVGPARSQASGEAVVDGTERLRGL
jgi:hypothetical protein